MLVPGCLNRMSNWSLTPGSPASLARTTKLTLPNKFVVAVPQMRRAPIGRPLGEELVPSSRYAVMLVQWAFRPVPWSMYSRWPQVGEPFLHPPPTPKFALAPLCTIHPPPVRKSHGGVAQASTRGAVAVPTTSTALVTTSATSTRPDPNLQILFALSLICGFSSHIWLTYREAKRHPQSRTRLRRRQRR